jgi:outer membrane protein assembly factor BamB
MVHVRDMDRRHLLSGFVAIAGLAAGPLTARGQAPGTLLWRAQEGSGYGGESLAPLAVAGGFLYAASHSQADGDAAIYALNAATGAPAWHTQSSGPMPYAAGPDAVYGFQVTGGGSTTSVAALSAAAGRPLWTYDAGHMLDNAGLGSLAYANGMVIIGGGTSDTFTTAANTVTAIDAGTGREVWKVTGTQPQQPAVANGIVYAQDGKQQVVALNTATGKRIWQSEFRHRWTYRLKAPASGITVTGTTLYALDTHGTAYALTA